LFLFPRTFFYHYFQRVGSYLVFTVQKARGSAMSLQSFQLELLSFVVVSYFLFDPTKPRIAEQLELVLYPPYSFSTRLNLQNITILFS